MTTKMRILKEGVKIKLTRGEDLEGILSAYVNLTEAEKQELRQHFSE